MKTILTLFGTRPEIIKLAAVMRELGSRASYRSLQVSSSQHSDLLEPFLRLFRLRLDHDLKVMDPGQTPSQVLARVVTALDPILVDERPDLVLVQGDTTTTLAGALAAFHREIPVGHVEAGLRTGDPTSPFPEEMNRRLVSRLATLHFAPTRHNVEMLRAEHVPLAAIELTGNPVVDSLQDVIQDLSPSAPVAKLLAGLDDKRLVLLTTHRRESFGPAMAANLRVLRRFVERHPEVALVFPVHPNPAVREAADEILAGAERVVRLDPLDYFDFIYLMSRAWLIVSDSGGVQEEAPTLGKPVLVLRDNTERPEAIEAGVARLVGGSAERLESLLEEACRPSSWIERVREVPNPFGRGDSGRRIVDAIDRFFEQGSEQGKGGMS